MADFSPKIIEEIGVLSSKPNGWTKELNLVSWGGRDPKYDIRDWDPEHIKVSKGTTLSKEELVVLKDLLAKLELAD